MRYLDRCRGALLGLAVGDAVGTTLEFKPRGSFVPIDDMVGGGPFDLEAGEWTDDTSMALCLGRSLLDCGGFDAHDQMRRYVRWWKQGYLSSHGECFDIGNTTREALQRFVESGNPWAGPTEPHRAGNGSLMRLAPIPLFCAPDATQAVRRAADCSRTTHASPEAVDACQLLASQIVAALGGVSKNEILFGAHAGIDRPLAPAVQALADGAWRDKTENVIRGTGYAVQALEAALWCFHRTQSFRDAVLAAANLGDDADTTAAIVGQLAGAHYGEKAIPAEWRARLRWGHQIAALGEALGRAGTHPDAPFDRSYWVVPGQLLAGPYPMSLEGGDRDGRVRSILAAGVRTFINLMEPNELDRSGRPFIPYSDLVDVEARRLGVEVACHRFAIRDNGVPSVAVMAQIQGALDASLAEHKPVYVHCWGGRGRTGIVVAIYLIRHGFADADDFVDAIARRRRIDSESDRSPEVLAQMSFVREYVRR